MDINDNLYTTVRKDFSEGGKVYELIHKQNGKVYYNLQKTLKNSKQMLSVYGGEYYEEFILNYAAYENFDMNDIFNIISECGYDSVIKIGNTVFIDQKNREAYEIEYLKRCGNDYFLDEILNIEFLLEDYNLEFEAQNNKITMTQFKNDKAFLKKIYTLNKTVSIDELICIINGLNRVIYNKIGNRYKLSKR